MFFLVIPSRKPSTSIDRAFSSTIFFNLFFCVFRQKLKIYVPFSKQSGTEVFVFQKKTKPALTIRQLYGMLSYSTNYRNPGLCRGLLCSFILIIAVASQ